MPLFAILNSCQNLRSFEGQTQCTHQVGLTIACPPFQLVGSEGIVLCFSFIQVSLLIKVKY